MNDDVNAPNSGMLDFLDVFFMTDSPANSFVSRDNQCGLCRAAGALRCTRLRKRQQATWVRISPARISGLARNARGIEECIESLQSSDVLIGQILFYGRLGMRLWEDERVRWRRAEA